MKSATMRFKLEENEMRLQNQGANGVLEEMRKATPLSTAYIIDLPLITDFVASGKFLKTPNLAFAGVAVGSKGVFWNTFLVYIFPWLLDIAKVFCALRIAQSFYQEKRGGRDEGTGMGAVVAYGKWYLIFWMIPWAVELIDQLGGQMFNDLRANPVKMR